MIDVIHKSGTSFRGLVGQYLLHDKGATTSERVAWTHTHNIATSNASTAWKVQAATAMNQGELKKAAGIKNTGRKSTRSVMHYTLSWHPDERKELTKDEMIKAAMGSLSYLGVREGEKLGRKKTKAGYKDVIAPRTQFADDHQVIIVAHDDGPGTPPHLHIVVNMVEPKHGVFLPTNFTKEKLSAWALAYRQAQGKTQYCEQRTKNWAKKAAGFKTWNPRKPRNVYETEKAIEAAEPGSRKKAILEQHQRRAKELQKNLARLKERQAAAIQSLDARRSEDEKTIKAKAGNAAKAAAAKIKSAYEPKLDALIDQQKNERAAFAEARRTLGGRVRNTWKALQAKEWMREVRTDRLHAVTGAFKLAFSGGLQEQQLQSIHRRELGCLNGEIKREQKAATAVIRVDERGKLDELKGRYFKDRADLLLENGMDDAKLKTEWKQLDWDRRVAAADEREKAKNLRNEKDTDQGTGSASGVQPTKRAVQSPLSDEAVGQAKPADKGEPPSKEDRKAAQAQKRAKNLVAKRAGKKRNRGRDENDRGR